MVHWEEESVERLERACLVPQFSDHPRSQTFNLLYPRPLQSQI